MPTMRSRLFTCLLTNLILLSIAINASAQSAEDLKRQTSLKFIPADASFSSVMLRNREQFDRIANSKAIQKMLQLPLVTQGIDQLKQEWENPSDGDFEEFRDFVRANDEIVELLIDSVSSEMFVYGGDGYGKTLRLFNEFNNKVNAAQFEALGRGEQFDQPEEVMLDWVEQNIDDLNVVDTVVGMKLSDTERAKRQIARLEELIKQAIDQEEEAAFLKDALKRRMIAGSEFLTLDVSGEMIPWEEMDVDEGKIDPKRLEQLKAKLKNKTATVALGVHDGYLLLAIGRDDSVIAQLGKGPLLIDDPKMAPVLKAADQRLTQVAFASETFMKEASATEQQLDQMKTMGKALLPFANLNEDDEQKIKDDIDQLTRDLTDVIPTPGPILGFTFMTPNGYEGYQYNWTENLLADGSKPLTILEHVGGDPIMFFAGRTKYSPDAYAMLVKWLNKGYGYAEQFAVPKMDDDQQEKFAEASERLLPLLARLDKANREMLMPAFSDGQGAMVVDAKQESTQWQAFMPPTDTALPMLEVALVYGVSDKDLLMKGFAECFEVAQELLKNLNEMEPNQIPPVQIPPAETKDVEGGTIHYYRLPAMAGLDKAVAPNTGISDRFFVMSLLPKMTQRLLASSQIDSSGPLQKKDQPLHAAWQFRIANLASALEPWVDYGMSISDMDEDEVESILEQVHTMMDVVRCFKSASGVGYSEDGAMVMHYESRFEDLE